MDKTEVATRAGASIAISLLGYSLGPAGAILAPGAKEVVSPHLKRVADILRGRHESALVRAIKAMEEAERIAAIDAEKLLDTVMNNPPLLDLFARALTAVYESEVDAKLDALARSMATAAQDTTTIDEEQLFIATVRHLEAPHITFLSAAVGVGQLEYDDGGWKIGAVAASVGLSPTAARPVARTLEGVGCIEIQMIVGPSQLFSINTPVEDYAPIVTPFGEQVLARLRQS